MGPDLIGAPIPIRVRRIVYTALVRAAQPTVGPQNQHHVHHPNCACIESPGLRASNPRFGTREWYPRPQLTGRLASEQKKTPRLAGPSSKRMKGLEPSTFCMASRRSSQLSYIRASGPF